MARVRQARRCRAHRTDGQPCKAYAILGGTVCRAHGGAAPQVAYAAYVESTRVCLLRQFNREYERWLRELAEWRVRRILETAELLDISVEDVNDVMIGYCRACYGRPAGPDSAPAMRRDHRYGPRPARA